MITIEQILALNPCYSRERIEELMRLDPYEALCSIPHPDARWVVARLMTSDTRSEWARASARRAAEYAAALEGEEAAAWAAAWAAEARVASRAARVARVAWVASRAAWAAAWAAWAASAGAEARAAEHHIAIRHALLLLGVSHNG